MRGEEWLTSVPLHLQLFKAFDLAVPTYAHLAPICKLDAGKKRKLSKRQDPEANVAFFFERGYSTQGLMEYIMTLADSSFEDWRKAHPQTNLDEFYFDMSKISVAWPLFDQQKLDRINNNYLSQLPISELYQQTLERALNYAPEYANYLQAEPNYAQAAINIERFTEKDPKRYTTYQDVKEQSINFFDQEREKNRSQREAELKAFLASFEKAATLKEHTAACLQEYQTVFSLETDTLTRFEQLKEIWEKHGFAPNNATFKTGNYLAKVGDIAMILRILLLNTRKTPDLCSLMKVMGKERVIQRISSFFPWNQR